MLNLAGEPVHEPRLAELKRGFEARTGAFGSENEWFDARSAAFLEDALCARGFLRDLAAGLGPEHRALVPLFECARRGLFRPSRAGKRWRLRDAWDRTDITVSAEDEGLVSALSNVSGYVDGRVVGEGSDLILLPGAIFHRADATEPMTRLIPIAQKRSMSAGDFLDALLRMDHALLSLARVKATFAYRVEALRGA